MANESIQKYSKIFMPPPLPSGFILTFFALSADKLKWIFCINLQNPFHAYQFHPLYDKHVTSQHMFNQFSGLGPYLIL